MPVSCRLSVSVVSDLLLVLREVFDHIVKPLAQAKLTTDTDNRQLTEMRSIVFLFFLAMPFVLLAEDAPVDSLPLAVRETIDAEKGDGVVKSAESFVWGDATIFIVEIDVGGVPALELQIAGNGKLIRVDSLQVEKDDDDASE